MTSVSPHSSWPPDWLLIVLWFLIIVGISGMVYEKEHRKIIKDPKSYFEYVQKEQKR
jgi:hypothetical protein